MLLQEVHLQFFYRPPLGTALRSLWTLFISVPGLALTHVQDLALGIVELHEVHTGTPLRTLKDPWMAFLPSSESMAPHILALISSAYLKPKMECVNINNENTPPMCTVGIKLFFVFRIQQRDWYKYLGLILSCL